MILNEVLDSSDLAGFLSPWKDFGKILKGELKKTVINLNLYLTVMLGPNLTRADYAELVKQTKPKIDKIDAEVNAAMDRIPVSTTVKGILFAINPAAMTLKAVRDVSGKVTPNSVGKFMDEYGFSNLALGPIPVGAALTKIAQAGAKAGNFATLQGNIYDRDMDELERDAEAKWYTPLERLFRLQDPRGPGFRRRNESLSNNGELLLENEEPSSEAEAMAFANAAKLSGFEDQYMKKIAIPYVEAKDKLITGLVDILEQDLAETSAIAAAPTFEEFLKAVQDAKLEKFKPLNPQGMKTDMEKEVAALIADKENLDKFLDVVKVKKEDFNEDELKKFVTQKLYEKEFTEARIKSIQSISKAVEDIKDEILGDIEESDLKDLKGTPLGDQMFTIFDSALKRLDASVAKIAAATSAAQKV